MKQNPELNLPIISTLAQKQNDSTYHTPTKRLTKAQEAKIAEREWAGY